MSGRGVVRALALLFAAGVAAACGSGDGSPVVSSTASPAPSPSLTVSAAAPADWQMQAFTDQAGAWLRTAPVGVDLLATVAGGPRLVVSPVPSNPPNARSAVDAIGVRTFVGSVSTTAVTIAGRPGVAVDWTESGPGYEQTYREILVDLGGGHAYRILLEAPASGWAAAAPTLERVAATIAFQ
ncbi:MAG: hypothetical protein ACRDF7_00600 [Candidatus Limnocylindrales bacterium]